MENTIFADLPMEKKDLPGGFRLLRPLLLPGRCLLAPGARDQARQGSRGGLERASLVRQCQGWAPGYRFTEILHWRHAMAGSMMVFLCVLVLVNIQERSIFPLNIS